MKGLALDTIWIIIVAVAAVLLFLSLISGTLKESANWLYCNFYLNILNLFSQTSGNIPDICKYNIKGYTKVEDAKDTNNTMFSRKLLAYIISCWNDAEIKENYDTHPCFELHLSGGVENVSEMNVSTILNKEDHCKSIENYDYGCGEKNQIIWYVDGNITSLTKQNLADAINYATVPQSIPIENYMIPSPKFNGIKTKLELQNFLAVDVPTSICASVLSCSSWEYNTSTDIVTFKLGSTDFSYSINLVTSYLEKNELINSVISEQKIILIYYNGPKEAIEVFG